MGADSSWLLRSASDPGSRANERPDLDSVRRISAAAPAAVFQVLEDIDLYPEWNEFTGRVITERKVGGSVMLHINMPGSGGASCTSTSPAVSLASAPRET